MSSETGPPKRQMSSKALKLLGIKDSDAQMFGMEVRDNDNDNESDIAPPPPAFNEEHIIDDNSVQVASEEQADPEAQAQPEDVLMSFPAKTPKRRKGPPPGLAARLARKKTPKKKEGDDESKENEESAANDIDEQVIPTKKTPKRNSLKGSPPPQDISNMEEMDPNNFKGGLSAFGSLPVSEQPVGGGGQGAVNMEEMDPNNFKGGFAAFGAMPAASAQPVANMEEMDPNNFKGGFAALGAMPAANSVPPGAGAPPAEAAGPNLDGPLEKHLVSSIWKTRQAAFTKLTEEFKTADDGASVFSQYGSFLKKGIEDANIPTQLAALEAVCLYVDRHKIDSEEAEVLAKALLKKGFAGRGASTSTDIVLMMVECGLSQVVIPIIVEGFTNRVWKVANACGDTVLKALEQFGPRVVNINDSSVWLPKLFAHANGTVRKMGVSLSVEIYKWLGDLFIEQLEGMKGVKPPQVNEVKAAVKSVEPGSGKPSRKVRGADGGAGGKKKKGKKGQEEKEEAFDPLSLVAAKDITKDVSKKWESEVLAPKWKDKKEKIDELLAACCQKIEMTSRLEEMVKIMKKLFSDSNVVVVGSCVKCIAAIAKGTQRDFAGVGKGCVYPLLDLLKEKKSTVNQPCNEALDILFTMCVPLPEMMGAIKKATGHKVPKVRVELYAWLVRCLKHDKVNKKELKECFKELWDMCAAVIEDGDPGIRDNSLHVLGLLLGHMGEKQLRGQIAKIESDNPKKHAKLLKYSEEVSAGGGDDDGDDGDDGAQDNDAEEEEVAKPKARRRSMKKKAPERSSSRSRSRPRAGSRPASRGPPKGFAEKLSGGRSKSKPKSRPGSARPPSRSAKGGSSGKGASASSASSSSASLAIDFKNPEPTPYESCEQDVLDFVGDVSLGEDSLSFVDAISSKKWKDRQEAVDTLKAKIEEAREDVSDTTDSIVYFLHAKPSFKESNAMVLQSIVELFGCLAQASTSMEEKHAALIVPVIANKLTDRKVVGAAPTTLSNLAEAVGPTFVIGLMVTGLKKVRAPAAQAKGIEWVATCISEFGLGTVPVQDLIAQTHTWLAAMNPQVKSAATNILVAVYKQTGSVLRDKMLDGLKPALATAIEKEFDSIPESEIGSAAPLRAVKGQEAAAPLGLDDLVPRTDISKMITDKLLDRMKDGNWKTRKEALDEVEGILAEASHRIGPDDGGLMSGLKGRMSDSNKNLIRQACDIVTMVAEDMGPPVKTYGKYVLPGVLETFADAKKHLVASAKEALTKWLEVAGFASVVKYLGKGLKNAKARAELLPVLADALDKETERLDLADLVTPVILCVQDRIASVRSAAERLLKHIIKSVGFHIVNSEISSQKKAVQLQLAPLLEKLRDEVESESSSAAPAKSRARSRSRPRTAAGSSKGKKPTKGTRPKSSRGRKRSPSPSSEEEEEEEEEKKPARSGRTGRAAGRGTLTRSTSSKMTKSNSKTAFMEEDEDAVLIASDQRTMEKRLRRDAKRMQGAYRAISKDEVEDMKEACEAVFSKKLHKLMFSRDFAEHVKGLELLEGALGDLFDETISNLDLILKWCGFRMADANTSVLLKALEYLDLVLAKMVEEEMTLEDGHIFNIVPPLVNEVLGHNKVQFRNSCHKIIQIICDLYAVPKIYHMLLDGLKSKNKRTVSESLDEMGDMIQRLGLSTCKAERSLVLIGKEVGNSDNGIRTAALGALQKVYQVKGDVVWKYLGGKDGRGKNPLPAKQRDLIMERFKRTKVTGEPSGAAEERPARPSTAAPSGSRPSSSSRPAPNSGIPRPGTAASSRPRTKEQQARGRATPPKRDTPPRSSNKAAAEYVSSSVAHAGPPTSLDPNVAAVFDLDFDSIGKEVGIESSSTVSTSEKYSDYSLPSTMQSSISRAEEPAAASSSSYGLPSPSSTGLQSSSALTGSGAASSALGGGSSSSAAMAGADSSGVYSYVVQIERSAAEHDRIEAMRSIWQLIKKQGPHVVRPNTDKLIDILVSQIRLAFLPHERGEGLRLRLCKYALNLLLELFQSVEIAEDMHVNTHEALSHELLSHLTHIDSLSASDAGKHVVKSLNILMLKVLEVADRTSSFHVLLKFLAKSDDPVFNKLVVKCLLKITKALVTTIDTLNLDILMKGLHSFFVAHPRDEVQDGRSNTVMRTVRTTLNEIVKLKREGIRVYMKLIPSDSDIHYYVDNMLANLQNKPKNISPSPSQHSLHGLSPSNTSERMNSLRSSSSVRDYGNAEASEEKASAGVGASGDDPEAQLDHIFEMLHKKETTQEALKMLYVFKKQNAGYDMTRHMSSTSTVFQSYIERGLRRVEEQEKARQEASSAASSVSAERSSMATSPSPSNTALAYRNRLSQLQNKSSPSGRSSLGGGGGGTSDSSEQSAPSVSPSVSASPAASSSLARLRGRLEAAKSGMASNAPTTTSGNDESDPLARIRSRIQKIRGSDAS